MWANLGMGLSSKKVSYYQHALSSRKSSPSRINWWHAYSIHVRLAKCIQAFLSLLEAPRLNMDGCVDVSYVPRSTAIGRATLSSGQIIECGVQRMRSNSLAVWKLNSFGTSSWKCCLHAVVYEHIQLMPCLLEPTPLSKLLNWIYLGLKAHSLNSTYFRKAGFCLSSWWCDPPSRLEALSASLCGHDEMKSMSSPSLETVGQVLHPYFARQCLAGCGFQHSMFLALYNMWKNAMKLQHLLGL